MDRVNRILDNDIYKEHIRKIEELEIDRIYCHHDMTHFLDLARIATILAFEENLPIERDIIYAAALLHDIGRDVQYLTGEEHELASYEIAPAILKSSGYTIKETELIVEAIRHHGNEEVMTRNDLTGIIYRADKLSRKCFCCNAADSCHKRIDKRNYIIRY